MTASANLQRSSFVYHVAAELGRRKSRSSFGRLLLDYHAAAVSDDRKCRSPFASCVSRKVCHQTQDSSCTRPHVSCRVIYLHFNFSFSVVSPSSSFFFVPPSSSFIVVLPSSSLIGVSPSSSFSVHLWHVCLSVYLRQLRLSMYL